MSTTTYYTWDKSRRLGTWFVPGGQAHYFSYNQREMVTGIQEHLGAGDAPRSFVFNATGERAVVKDNSAQKPAYWAFDGRHLLQDRVQGGSTTYYRYNDGAPGGANDQYTFTTGALSVALSLHDWWGVLRRAEIPFVGGEDSYVNGDGIQIAGGIDRNRLSVADAQKLDMFYEYMAQQGGVVYAPDPKLAVGGGAVVGRDGPPAQVEVPTQLEWNGPGAWGAKEQQQQDEMRKAMGMKLGTPPVRRVGAWTLTPAVGAQPITIIGEGYIDEPFVTVIYSGGSITVPTANVIRFVDHANAAAAADGAFTTMRLLDGDYSDPKFRVVPFAPGMSILADPQNNCPMAVSFAFGPVPLSLNYEGIRVKLVVSGGVSIPERSAAGAFQAGAVFTDFVIPKAGTANGVLVAAGKFSNSNEALAAIQGRLKVSLLGPALSATLTDFRVGLFNVNGHAGLVLVASGYPGGILGTLVRPFISTVMAVSYVECPRLNTAGLGYSGVGEMFVFAAQNLQPSFYPLWVTSPEVESGVRWVDRLSDESAGEFEDTLRGLRATIPGE